MLFEMTRDRDYWHALATATEETVKPAPGDVGHVYNADGVLVEVRHWSKDLANIEAP